VSDVCWRKSEPFVLLTANKVDDRLNYHGLRKNFVFKHDNRSKGLGFRFLPGTTALHMVYQFHIPHFLESFALLYPVYMRPDLFGASKPARSIFLQEAPWEGNMHYQTALTKAWSYAGRHELIFSSLNNIKWPGKWWQLGSNVCFQNVVIGHGHWFFEPEYAKNLKSHFSSKPTTSPMTCILKRSITRAIVNVDEIKSMLYSIMPSKIITFDKLSFLQQVEIASSCSVLIASHGAGLSNIIFMPTNSTVIEIFPYAYSPAHYYRSLAFSSGINIFQLHSTSLSAENECARSFVNLSMNECNSIPKCLNCFKSSNFIVNTTELRDLLSRLFGFRP